VLAVSLFLVALAACRRLRTGSAALLVCFVLGAALTANHPNHQPRFLVSWLATGWAAAGVGLAVLLPGGRRSWAAGLGAVALAGIAWLNVPRLLSPGPAPEGGPRPERPSVLELTDYYAGDVRAAGRAMV